MDRTISQNELVTRAAEARLQAYAPYSRYLVGAALLAKSGRIYTGCNVENASYGLSICAERTAVVKAISEGEKEFRAIAVVTENGGSPCGACRQVLWEFTSPETPVIIADSSNTVRGVFQMGELLAEGFGPSKLPR